MISRRLNSEVGAVLSLVLLIAGMVSENLLWNKLAGLILLLTVLIPVVFSPLTRLWFSFGWLVERFFSMIILMLVFYLIVTPVAWLRRVFCDDALSLRAFKKDESSVFVIKDKTYSAEDLKKQY